MSQKSPSLGPLNCYVQISGVTRGHVPRAQRNVDHAMRIQRYVDSVETSPGTFDELGDALHILERARHRQCRSKSRAVRGVSPTGSRGPARMSAKSFWGSITSKCAFNICQSPRTQRRPPAYSSGRCIFGGATEQRLADIIAGALNMRNENFHGFRTVALQR